ncbi:hypothetical protein APHAL10511_005271 [Amanita phalloides]|nr:hypothetical protein APHAL10511_005271 [Amanita phalloides]
MMDVHWGSSLAVALRKLNRSYGKRTVELNKSREKISQLEAQLEDAWKEAERLAQEMDAYDAAIGSDGEDQVVISKAAIVSVSQSPRKEGSIPLPMVPTYFTVEALSRDGSKIALTHAPSPSNDSSPKYPDGAFRNNAYSLTRAF